MNTEDSSAKQNTNWFPVLIAEFRVIAKLQRAKCASEAPWIRKIGNPSSRENLRVQASERTSVQTRGEGEGRLEIFLTKCHLSLAVVCLKKSEKHSFLFTMSTIDRSG